MQFLSKKMIKIVLKDECYFMANKIVSELIIQPIRMCSGSWAWKEVKNK